MKTYAVVKPHTVGIDFERGELLREFGGTRYADGHILLVSEHGAHVWVKAENIKERKKQKWDNTKQGALDVVNR